MLCFRCSTAKSSEKSSDVSDDQWRIQEFWKWGGGEENVWVPSSFVANAHNELYAFYTEKGSCLKKFWANRLGGQPPLTSTLNPPLVTIERSVSHRTVGSESAPCSAYFSRSSGFRNRDSAWFVVRRRTRSAPLASSLWTAPLFCTCWLHSESGRTDLPSALEALRLCATKISSLLSTTI